MPKINPENYFIFEKVIDDLKQPIFRWSLKEIAAECRLHISTISKYFYIKYGINFRDMKRYQQQIIMQELIKSELSRQKIAEVLQVTEGCVSQILKGMQ